MGFLKKHLGNGFWETEDGRIFSEQLQAFIKKEFLPPTMKYDKSVGLYEVIEHDNFFDLEEGYKFVIFDFCETIVKHKKTLEISFTKFKTFDKTWRKYNSIKENNGFFHFDYNFQQGRAYMLFCERNEEFPDFIHIIKAKEI